MKKTKILAAVLITLIVMQSALVYGVVIKTQIKKVEITGIDYPYSTGSTLDTTADISKESKSIISSISWSKTDSGLHEVKVTVRPNINCYYSGDEVTATVNGKPASGVFLNEDKYLEILYIFAQDDSISIPNSSATLRHVIYAQYSINGSIEPKDIRVLDGKSVTVKIIPNDGYKISDVIVDGDSVGAVEEYEFVRVRETHKIKAYFEKVEDVEADDDDNNESNPFISNIIEKINTSNEELLNMIIKFLFNI